MTHTIKYHHTVKKYVKKLQKTDRVRVVNAMQALKTDPYPHGSVKLNEHFHRIRVGRYRVIYSVEDDVLMVIVCKVDKRSESTYRNLQRLLKRLDQMREDD